VIRAMTAKQRIQSVGDAERPYAHFQPIVEAEKSWGNRLLGDFTYNPNDGQWTAYTWRPLHLDKLRETFDFPATFELRSGPVQPAERPGDMHYAVIDTENMIKLHYRDVHGPSVAPVGRFFRRLLIGDRPKSHGDAMSGDDKSTGKQRIQSVGNAECPYAHFLPIVEAEKSWGNKLLRDFTFNPRENNWSASTWKPLHLDELREKFDFPDTFELRSGLVQPAERPGDKYYRVTDTENNIELYHQDMHGPSFEPVARLFRRLLKGGKTVRPD
jgi:hypothetical protein